MKVSIIIPAYNEASTVGILLDRVWAQPLAEIAKEIIVVESNSTDGTREIVAQFAARHAACAQPVRVIYQETPKGKGNAVRAGLSVASGDIVLIQDADLEYEVADYPSLLDPIIQGRAAFVLGSRHLGTDHWKIRTFARHGVLAAFMNIGGSLFHAFFNALFCTRLTDPTTMFKVFRMDCLAGLTLGCDRFDFDFELLGKLIRAGFSPLEVPVRYRSRGFDEGKKIRIFRDPFTWVAIILKCRFAPMKPVRYRLKPADRASS
jgi:glycosyltransferase involved in cell wall biosynthesis